MRCISRKEGLPLSLALISSHLVYELDPEVPLLGLDGDPPGIDQLGQVYGLGRVQAAHVDQVLQTLQRQGLVLGPAAGKYNKETLIIMGYNVKRC